MSLLILLTCYQSVRTSHSTAIIQARRKVIWNSVGKIFCLWHIPEHLMVFRKVLKHHFVGALKLESAFHECCLWWVLPTDLPKDKQQVGILSAAPSPPPPHIGNYRTNKVHRSWATHQGYVNVHSWSLHKSIWNSAMPKEHKCICSRSEASIADATSQIEDLTTIVSKE